MNVLQLAKTVIPDDGIPMFYLSLVWPRFLESLSLFVTCLEAHDSCFIVSLYMSLTEEENIKIQTPIV
jgi:hypothetical protein